MRQMLQSDGVTQAIEDTRKLILTPNCLFSPYLAVYNSVQSFQNFLVRDLHAHLRRTNSHPINTSRFTSTALFPNTGFGSVRIVNRNFWNKVFGRKALNDLRKQAEDNPADAAIQAKLLQELNKASGSQEVQMRYENGAYAMNEEAKREYIKALVKLERFDHVNMNKLFQLEPESQGSFPLGRFLARPITVQIARSWGDTIGYLAVIIPTLLIVVAGVAFLLWYMPATETPTSKSFSIPVSGVHTQAKPGTCRLDDVLGIDEIREEVQEIIEFLKYPAKYKEMGAKLPKGVLFSGPPGTGKTLLARAIAGEAGVPFLSASGSAFDEMFVGVGASRVRKLFEDAKKLAPCIVFIDEIDTLGMSRRYRYSGTDNTLNQLLTELDGFEQSEGVIFIGATNLERKLDSALTRPGRFDKIIQIPVPDIKGRTKIIEHYLKKVMCAPGLDPSILARGTPGFTGAELENLINMAASKAVRLGKEYVDQQLLDEAKDTFVMGLKRKTGTEHPDDLRKTAYHEAGHALVALFTPGADPLHKATIIRRGRALGVTVSLPERDKVSRSRKQILARMAVCMGGRAAEELTFGDDEVTDGAGSDFSQATQLAEQMVTRLGMSNKFGKVYREDWKDFSDQEKLIIDDEDSYGKAKTILQDHRLHLDKVAEELLKRETLTGDEIKMIVEGKTLEEL